MTDIKLLRELLAKANPAIPWEVGGPYPGTSVIECVGYQDHGHGASEPLYDAVCILDQRTTGEPSEKARDCAALIAAAVNELPKLLDEVEDLRKQSARARLGELVETLYQDAPMNAAEANAQLAAIRTKPHNGKMHQADDVDYLLALAETAGRGLGAINPQWFRDQAKLVKGTLEEIEKLRAERTRLTQEIKDQAKEFREDMKMAYEEGFRDCRGDEGM